MPATFYSGTDWQDTSGPYVNRQVHEANCWPVDDNSGSGTKDELEDGLHPIIAIGGRTAADGRPLNVTGVVVSVLEGLTEAVDLVQVNIADGMIVRQYVDNTLTYAAGVPATFEQAPVVGQPVYVDDSNDLGEGTTCSLSPLNDADVANPMAGVLWYCEDEYADASVGGPNSSADWPQSWANEQTETEVCVLLINGWRELAAVQ